MATQDSPDPLQGLREGIRRSTIEIMKSASVRLQLAKQLGELKAAIGMDIESQDVEERLREEMIRESARMGLHEAFTQNLLELLIRESKRVQVGVRDRLKQS